MFCKKCGNEVMDEAVVCTKCGCAIDSNSVSGKNENSDILSTLAKVFMIIGTVIMGIYIIPLLWCLPMTMYYINKVKNGQKVGTAFKVCCILFVSTAAGVIMLCDKN